MRGSRPRSVLVGVPPVPSWLFRRNLVELGGEGCGHLLRAGECLRLLELQGSEVPHVERQSEGPFRG